MADKTIAIKVELQGTEAQQKKLSKLETEVKKLTNRRTQLNKALKKGTISLDQYGKEIAQVNTRLKAARREMLTTREAILGLDSFTKKIGRSFSKLGQTISGAFVGLFAIQKVFELGQAAAELITELDELTVGVQRLGDVSEETARQTAASISAISSTFGASSEEILTAANAVSSQFGIGIDEAVEKIKLGFAAGSNQSGEFLDILKEYPALLSEVGLTADESFALINQQVTQGIYSDKGVDAIKEAGLRLRELTPATRDALDGIGLSSVEIEKALTDGSKSIFDVIQDVSGELGKLPPQSAAVGTAIADIFGGPGEDAGLQFLTTLDDINLSFEDVVGNIDEYGQSQLDLVEAQEGFNDLVNDFFGESSTGWTDLKAGAISFTTEGLRAILEPLSGLIMSFKELFNESEGFRQAVFGIKSAFSALFTSIKVPFKFLIESFKTLISTVSFLIDGEFSKASDALVDGVSNIGKVFVDAGNDIAETFTNNVKAASDARINILTEEERKIKEQKEREIATARAAEKQKALDAIKASQDREKARQKAEKLAIKNAKKEARRVEKEEERKVKAEERFLEKVDKLRQQSNLMAIQDEKKLQLEKLRLKQEALEEEARLTIQDKEKLNTTLSQISSSFAVQQKAVEKSFQEKSKQGKINEIFELADLTLSSSKDLSDDIADIQLNSEKRRLERGLITEEEFAKRRFEIEKKAFQRQKAIDIAQAISNGALAITKAYGQGGITGFITSGLIAAQTAAQIAVISSQTFGGGGSFAEGGFTGDGFGSADATGFKQAGVVHEGEYVVPKRVLESQKGGQLVGALESMRLNKPTPLSSIGFANGGFAGGTSSVDMVGLRNEISAAVAQSIGAIQVVNNATDTVSEAVRVSNIQSEATFG
jgi:predicted  nucleic acid-binding Zn-ribbon protein